MPEYISPLRRPVPEPFLKLLRAARVMLDYQMRRAPVMLINVDLREAVEECEALAATVPTGGAEL